MAIMAIRKQEVRGLQTHNPDTVCSMSQRASNYKELNHSSMKSSWAECLSLASSFILLRILSIFFWDLLCRDMWKGHWLPTKTAHGLHEDTYCGKGRDFLVSDRKWSKELTTLCQNPTILFIMISGNIGLENEIAITICKRDKLEYILIWRPCTINRYMYRTDTIVPNGQTSTGIPQSIWVWAPALEGSAR